jgi:hypothetical protein
MDRGAGAPNLCAISARTTESFDYIGENGRPAARAEVPYRLIRKKDGKIFKWARFVPQRNAVDDVTALEEI